MCTICTLHVLHCRTTRVHGMQQCGQVHLPGLQRPDMQPALLQGCEDPHWYYH